jgi:hypothetical protein
MANENEIKASEVEAVAAPAPLQPGEKVIKLDDKDANRLRQASMILTQAQQQWQQAQNMILGEYLRDVPPNARVEIQAIDFVNGAVKMKIVQ